MTSFGPGGMDCDEVLAEVYLYLDEETGEDERRRIRIHLDECGPCLRKFGLEQDVIALVHRSCGGDQAPGALKSRIRTRLTEVVIETSRVEYRAD